VRSVCGKVSVSNEVPASLAGFDTRGLFEGVDGTRRLQRAARFEGGVTVGAGVGADAGLGK
jgi:hypothetical protein